MEQVSDTLGEPLIDHMGLRETGICGMGRIVLQREL